MLRRNKMLWLELHNVHEHQRNRKLSGFQSLLNIRVLFSQCRLLPCLLIARLPFSLLPGPRFRQTMDRMLRW